MLDLRQYDVKYALTGRSHFSFNPFTRPVSFSSFSPSKAISRAISALLFLVLRILLFVGVMGIPVGGAGNELVKVSKLGPTDLYVAGSNSDEVADV